jgi:hypothetical protein
VVIVRHPHDINYRCINCGRCWHVSMGLWITRENPFSCPGCPDAAACAAALPDGDVYRRHLRQGPRMRQHQKW